MGDDVRLVYRKFNGDLHWHATLRRLGTDGYGTWLGAPAGTLWQRGVEPPEPFPSAHVVLIPVDRWWTAVFNAPPAANHLYSDITTPAVWASPGEVTMIDLDLDVIVRRDSGQPEIVDQDEFAAHQVRYGYPADVIAAATRAAADVYASAAAGIEPFGHVWRRWLAGMS